MCVVETSPAVARPSIDAKLLFSPVGSRCHVSPKLEIERYATKTIALHRRGCLSACPLLALHAPVRAEDNDQEIANEQNVLSLIPSETQASSVIRNLQELTNKGQELIDQTVLKYPGGFSLLTTIAFGVIGVGEGIDYSQPIMLSVAGEQASPEWLIAIPVADVKSMALNCGVTANKDHCEQGSLRTRITANKESGLAGIRFSRTRAGFR